eukprot:scaffold27_cov355-Prasinococcus_capsulatus_cf.AAC.3
MPALFTSRSSYLGARSVSCPVLTQLYTPMALRSACSGVHTRGVRPGRACHHTSEPTTASGHTLASVFENEFDESPKSAGTPQVAGRSWLGLRPGSNPRRGRARLWGAPSGASSWNSRPSEGVTSTGGRPPPVLMEWWWSYNEARGTTTTTEGPG